MGTNSDETRWEGSAQPARKASHDTKVQEDVQEHQCHWQAFPFQQIPWHNPKAKPTELNKDFKSQAPPREEAPPAHLRGECLFPPKARTWLNFFKCSSPLMMNTTQIRRRHIDHGFPLDSKMGRQPMLTPKMQHQSLGGHSSFMSKARSICKTRNSHHNPSSTDRRDKKEVTYYRSSC